MSHWGSFEIRGVPTPLVLGIFAILVATTPPLAAAIWWFEGSKTFGNVTFLGTMVTVIMAPLMLAAATTGRLAGVRRRTLILAVFLAMINIIHGVFLAEEVIRATVLGSLFLLTFAMIGLFATIRPDALSVSRVMVGFSVGGAFMFGLMVIAAIDPQILSSYEWVNEIPGFSHVRHLGHVMAIAALAGAIVIMAGPHSLFPIAAATMFLSSATLFWSGSRAGVLALVVFFVLVFPVVRRSVCRFRLIAVSGLLAASLVLSMIVPTPTGHFEITSRAASTIEAIQADRDPTSRRLGIWSAVIEKIVEKPFLGHGFLQLRSIKDPRITVPDAHSFPLEILFSWGIPAGFMILLIMGSFMILTGYRAYTLAATSVLSYLLWAAAAAFFAMSLIDFSMSMGYSRLFFAFCLGAAWTRFGDPDDTRKLA